MARTVVIPPIQTAGLNNMYAIQEDGDIDSPVSPSRTRRRSSHNRVPGTPPLSALNSPRRLSNSSNSSALSRESARSELQRASSWGSKTSFESFESGHWKPVDFGPRSPGAAPTGQSQGQHDEDASLLDRLPDAVLGCVLDQLKDLHLNQKAGGTCATCWMRDVCSVSLASRKWSKAARVALYGDIQLVGPDSAAHKKRFKLPFGGRLLLLRRTLRADPSIARLVRTLKVPRPEPKIKGVTAKMVEQYEDLVATVIMACPRLEAVSGPLTTYSHGFKKTFHALSTRPHLREMTWVLEPTAAQRAAQTTHKGAAAATAAANDDLLDEAGCSPFVDLHRNWQSLRQLSIHCHPGGGHLGSETVLAQTLSMLPSLEHLHLSHLPAATFDDTTLLSLPGGLRTLSLTGTGGITAGGLSAFATRPQSQDLRTLTLRHTPMTSLAALARVLSNLSSLTSVTLAQAFPPMMPEGDGDAFTLWMMPYLASASVRSIHWDITSHRDCANVADDILARSIASGGFPALRSLRTPNDPDGIFQNLCRPLERIDLSTDRFCASDMPRRQPSPPLSSSVSASTSSFDNPPTPSSGGGGTGFLFGLASPRHTPTTPHSPSFFPELAAVPSPCTDLRIARLSAQTRLERARAKPRFSVTVTDHDYPDVDGPAGRVVDKFGIGGFLGTVGSPINYVLLPDRGSADERGGAVDLRDLLYHNGDSGEPLGVGPADGVIDRNDVDRQVCCGTWNNSDGFFSEKKEKERWWHTERARWSKVQLQQ